MTNAIAMQINKSAQDAALDAIKTQKAKGVDASFPQPRSAAIVAYALAEVFSAYAKPAPKEGEAEVDEGDWIKFVVKAALTTGPLMQGSTLQKFAVKQGVYDAKESVSTQYDC